jgi:hypothetical protein
MLTPGEPAAGKACTAGSEGGVEKRTERQRALLLPYYGKPRQLTLTNGTITIRRPRVRDLNERFVSRILPLFKRQTKEVGELLPQLYLHGLALGDFELALRGLLGRVRRCPLLPCCG